MVSFRLRTQAYGMRYVVASSDNVFWYEWEKKLLPQKIYMCNIFVWRASLNWSCFVGRYFITTVVCNAVYCVSVSGEVIDESPTYPRSRFHYRAPYPVTEPKLDSSVELLYTSF